MCKCACSDIDTKTPKLGELFLLLTDVLAPGLGYGRCADFRGLRLFFADGLFCVLRQFLAIRSACMTIFLQLLI